MQGPARHLKLHLLHLQVLWGAFLGLTGQAGVAAVEDWEAAERCAVIRAVEPSLWECRRTWTVRTCMQEMKTQ